MKERRLIWRRVTDSASIASTAKLFVGMAKLGDIILSAGSDSAQLKVYDGVNSTGKLLLRLDAVVNTSIPVQLKYSVKCHVGIFITLSGTDPLATLTWKVIPKGVEQ